MQPHRNQNECLAAVEIDALRAIIARRGSVVRASRALGVPRLTLERALAALPVRAGTRMMIRAGLAAESVPAPEPRP